VPRWVLVAAPLAALLALSASALTAQAQPAYDQAEEDAIAGDLVCECGTTITVADCGDNAVANGMRAIIRQQVTLGKSRAEVLDHFASLYGECILAEPRKSGIGLIAWLGPLVAIVVGGAALGGSMWAWAHRSGPRRGGPPSQGEASTAAGGLDEYERRVEDELKRFE
jgi:cytochrome c-type biogenesis protein CcmH